MDANEAIETLADFIDATVGRPLGQPRKALNVLAVAVDLALYERLQKREVTTTPAPDRGELSNDDLAETMRGLDSIMSEREDAARQAGYEAGRAEERREAVAWLAGEGGPYDRHRLVDIIDAITAGEHATAAPTPKGPKPAACYCGPGVPWLCLPCRLALPPTEAAPKGGTPEAEPTWVDVPEGSPEDGALLAAEYRGFHLFVWGHDGDDERDGKWSAAFTDSPGGPEWTREGYEEQASAQRAVVGIVDSLAPEPPAAPLEPEPTFRNPLAVKLSAAAMAYVRDGGEWPRLADAARAYAAPAAAAPQGAGPVPPHHVCVVLYEAARVLLAMDWDGFVNRYHGAGDINYSTVRDAVRAAEPLLAFAPAAPSAPQGGPDASSPNDLRAAGWAVAVHNDYRVDGEAHTFWLLTRGRGLMQAVLGEGRTDAEALSRIRATLAASPPHGERPEPGYQGPCPTHGTTWLASEPLGCPDCQDAPAPTYVPKVGDRVQAWRAFTSDEEPRARWVPGMADYVGRVGTVDSVRETYADVEFDDGKGWLWHIPALRPTSDEPGEVET